MKFGLLADIHGDVQKLKQAIDQLTRLHVDQFVTLGDIIYDGSNAAETVDLLRECGAIGVFGNHELGLCVEPSERMLCRFDDRVVDFFGSLKPQLPIGEVMFSHTWPHLDATDLLSYYDGQSPEQAGALTECFARTSQRVIMIGHFHHWFAATPEGSSGWAGVEPFELSSQQQYFFILGAVMNGAAALFDDDQNVLRPVNF